MHLMQPVGSAVGLMQLTHVAGLAKRPIVVHAPSEQVSCRSKMCFHMHHVSRLVLACALFWTAAAALLLLLLLLLPS